MTSYVSQSDSSSMSASHLGSQSQYRPRRFQATRWWAALGVLALLFYPSAAVAQAPLEDDRCYRIAVDEDDAPLWMVNGVWDSATGESSIIWLDAARREIQQVSLSGEIEEKVLPWKEELELRKEHGRVQGPSAIWNDGPGYRMEFKHPKQVMALNAELQQDDGRPAVPIYRKSASAEEVGLLAAYSLTPVSDGFLAFAAIEELGARTLNNAFVFYSPSDGVLNVFDKIEHDAPLSNQYTRYYMPFLTTVRTVTDEGAQERGYILFLDAKPRIGEFTPGQPRLRKLDLVPEDFRHRPVLEPHLNSKASVYFAWEEETEFYRELERSDLAAGIYTLAGIDEDGERREGIYLLGKKTILRSADDIDTKAAWWLVRLDTETGAELYRKRLPTSASHLTVIPGPIFTALVEKGPVIGHKELRAPYMPVRHMVVVPTAWITDEHSRGLDADIEDSCGLHRSHPGFYKDDGSLIAASLPPSLQ